jgi:hypothetical protein
MAGMNEWMPINQNRTEPEHKEFEDGCQQTARKIAGRLYEPCKEHDHVYDTRRFECYQCMESLRKEVGL